MHAFGEVHMLSHFMGGSNRHNVKELWLAQRRLDQLADAVARDTAPRPGDDCRA